MAVDSTAPVITVLLNTLSVNATTTTGQLLVVTTVYVGEYSACKAFLGDESTN